MNVERLIAKAVARQQKRLDEALAVFGVALALRTPERRIVLPRVAFGRWQPDSEGWKPRNWQCGAVFQRKRADQVETVCIPWPDLPVRFVARWRSKIEQG